MRRSVYGFGIVILVTVLVSACTPLTGKRLGENIDDASITAEVKAKLVREDPAFATRVNVDTVQRTVYLIGVVESRQMRRRASEIAREVEGVKRVVNNLKVQSN